MTGSSATLAAGVAGFPIAGSLSPVLHSAWIAAAGLDATYRAFGPEDEAGFNALIATGRAGGLRGLNVTAPFKARALAVADQVGPAAKRCGSANLLSFVDGQIYADSTDGMGLMAALAEQAPGLDLTSGPVMLLGAGGAARAAAAALIDAGAQVHVLNRSRDRTLDLIADLGPGAHVADPATTAAAALVINALPVAPDLDLDTLSGDVVLMDMTYRPLITPFLAAGRARGLTVVDGLAMLIGQARPSFEALFGSPVPDLDARAVALAAMAIP